MKIKIPQIEKKIGHIFKDKMLLKTALTHRSYAHESKKNTPENETLEFLGDSVVGFLIADFLYRNYTALPEGELSKLKSTAASTSSLASFARKIGLDKRIILGKGEEKSGGRKKETILAGAFEALVAALYLDAGLNAAQDFFLPLLKSLFKKVDVQKFIISDYKSALQEHYQRQSLPSPVYKTIKIEGPEHKKSFVIKVISGDETLAVAKSHSKKSAEQKAAQKALKKILGKRMKSLTPETFFLQKK